MKMPNSTCWNITGKCNDNCLFCYRDKGEEELDFKSRLEVIEKIAASGIRKLTFAGGEPLLVQEIQELILYARQKGLYVSLTTNGILLDHVMLDFCLENLDWLTLPLDGADENTQRNMTRKPGHEKRVFEILEAVKKWEGRRCKIKINTVVSHVNEEHMGALADFISKNPVDRWKLFQFVPLRGNARRHGEQFLISDSSFADTAQRIRAQLGTKSSLLSVSDRKNIESAYFVIFQNGDIKISTGLRDRVLGNVLEHSLQEIWQQGGYEREAHENRTKFILMEKSQEVQTL